MTSIKSGRHRDNGRTPAVSDPRGSCPAAPGVVVIHSPAADDPVHGHDAVTRARVAERIAAIKGFDFAGEYDASGRYPGTVYFVPCDTLVGIDAARALGIRGEHDLFGAVVPHPFMATKAISHPVVGRDARTPDGWSSQFGEQVQETVLRGFSAFATDDARRAGLRMLEQGPLRIKPVRATGGRGQIVIRDAAALDRALGGLEPAELTRYGVVLEENLSAVSTYSVGQVCVGELVATYVGTQSLTRDNAGGTVYGGSRLTVVRSGFEALLALDLTEEVRLAIAKARAYDSAAMACFPGMFGSRRNYDVAEGIDRSGRRCCGVLEQSWRIGGASGAEIVALERFRADPALRVVRAVCVERYGEAVQPPPDAVVYFRGIDERFGPITKYALVEPYGDPG